MTVYILGYDKYTIAVTIMLKLKLHMTSRDQSINE